MKQISAILIACFLCTSTSQVSAQQVPNLKMVTNDNYKIGPDDTALAFIETTGSNTNCHLPTPSAANKFRLIRIFNRRGNALVINGKFEEPLKIGFKTCVEVMNDGILWFVVNKSY